MAFFDCGAVAKSEVRRAIGSFLAANKELLQGSYLMSFYTVRHYVGSQRYCDQTVYREYYGDVLISERIEWHEGTCITVHHYWTERVYFGDTGEPEQPEDNGGGGEGEAELPVTTDSLRASQSTLTIPLGGTSGSIVVTAYRSDNSTADVSSNSWIPDDPSIARGDDANTFYGVATGVTGVRLTYGGRSVTVRVQVLPEMESAFIADTLLNCADTVSLAGGNNDLNRATFGYCRGRAASQTESPLIAAAIQAIRSRGGVCALAANALDSIFLAGRIRMSDGVTYTAASQQGNGTDSFLSLNPVITKFLSPADSGFITPKGTTVRYLVTLQSVLFHESYHILGPRNLADSLRHLPNTHNQRVPNEFLCSDLPNNIP